MKKVKKLTASEMIIAISPYWANVNDIQKIGAVGKNKATIIRNSIKEQITEEKQEKLPAYEVPMEKVIDYFDIDIEQLKRKVKLETKLKKI